MGFFLSPLRALGKGGLPAQTLRVFEVRIQLLGSRGDRWLVFFFLPKVSVWKACGPGPEGTFGEVPDQG